VYRVNEKNKYSGNKEGGEHGELDHIFVFRPNETELGAGNGNLSQATLNLKRPKLGKNIDVNNHDFDNGTIYYSNGGNSGIVIEVIGETKESVTFNVTFPSIGGDGTEASPYLISDVNTFLYLMQMDTKGKYYELTNGLIKLKELNKYPLLFQKSPSNTREFLDNYLKANNIHLLPQMEIVSYNLIMDFVSAGFGIGYATKEFIKEELESKKLYEIDITPKVPKRYIGIVTLNKTIPNYSVKKLIDLMINYNLS